MTDITLLSPLDAIDQTTLSMTKKQPELDKEKEWVQICEYLNHWYYKPDLDALAIALAVYAAHTRLDNKAVWLFVIGPSGTGKTEIVCNAIKTLPSVFEKSDISASALISGRSIKEGGNSLLFKLPRMGSGKDPTNTQGVIVFKDFTSILTRRPDIRAEIMSQLREVHDGSYSPVKGTKTMDWKGKVTIIAACTPALERHWGVQRELGERFIQVRWPREDGVATAFKAADQIDNSTIIPKFQFMIKNFVDVESLQGKTLHPPAEEFVYLAEMAANMRGTIIRDQGGHNIIDVPAYEAPTRLVKAMMQIAMGHAMLFRRLVPNEKDIELARRIALDSISINRLRVINNIGNGTSQSMIVAATGMQYSSVNWTIEELRALKVLIEKKSADSIYEFTDEFAKLRTKALGKDLNVLEFKKKL